MLSELRPFARHLRGRKGPLAAAFALGLAGAAATLAVPLVGMTFVDAVVERADFAAIPWIAAALVALALLDLGIGAVAARVHAGLSADLLADLRTRLFARCATGPLEAIEPYRHGDLLTRFGTDLPRIEALLVGGTLGALQSVLFVAVAAAITFALSPLLAAWSFAGIGLALAASTAFRRPVETRTHRVRDAMAALAHLLAERLANLRAMRFLATAGEDGARLAAANASLRREVVAFQWLDAAAGGLPALVLTLSLAWIYVVGGALLASGAITLGTFVAFVLYQGRLFAPAQGLLGLVRQWQQARVSVARIAEVLADEDTACTPVGSMPAAGLAIDVRDVVFAYPGKPPVLDGACLAVARGEHVALIGASGAGKTTLVQLIFGLRVPQAGAVHVAPRDALGYAGAEPFLLHASVADNLRYGGVPQASDAEVHRAARLACAHEFIAALPEAYATIVGGRGLALSDGQRQRLGLARLFLRRPRILVLDEAFSALDVDTELAIRRALRREFAGCTVLSISHRPAGLGEADRIVTLRDGVFATQPAAQAA